MKKLIYSQEDVDLILCLETQEYEDKINNLQSKIDKAIEYIENHFIFDNENGEYYQTHTFDKSSAKELHDILKEDKIMPKLAKNYYYNSKGE